MKYLYESKITDELSNEIENKAANAKALILLGKLSLQNIASCCELPLEKVQELAKQQPGN